MLVPFSEASQKSGAVEVWIDGRLMFSAAQGPIRETFNAIKLRK